ncbi:MAG: sigma-70 family RNA polymerase sigma factor [Pedobacter sp.]|nr:MAG: sigma-70 family RNA polymerase sigma factor [Pedobacter sp.]
MSLKRDSDFTEITFEQLDLDRFELIYKQWNVMLQRYADYYVRDHEASRSIVNDLFLKMWFSKRQPDNLKGYLFRSVKNAALNYLKKNGNIPLSYLEESELTTISDNSVGYTVEVEGSEKLSFLLQVIACLPERRQLVFRLHRLEGFSYAEIADLMQISVRTVEDHIAKSMQFIHAKAKHLVDVNLMQA